MVSMKSRAQIGRASRGAGGRIGAALGLPAALVTFAHAVEMKNR